MNRLKQADMIRKRNAELSKQLDDMKFKLEYNSQLNMEGYKHAKDLIVELEQLKQEWKSSIDDLNDKREKYAELIAELRTIKNIMKNMGFKIPWYKKLINKLKGL